MSDLTKGITDVHNESGELLSMFIVEQADVIDLLADALAGDILAAGLARCVLDTIAQIEDAPPDKPLLCAGCLRPVRGTSYYVVVAMAETDQPRHALGHAVCRHCAKTRGQAEETVLSRLHRIWPDMRKIRVMQNQGGCA